MRLETIHREQNTRYCIVDKWNIHLGTMSTDVYDCWRIFMSERPWWHKFMWYHEIRDYYIAQGYSCAKIRFSIVEQEARDEQG